MFDLKGTAVGPNTLVICIACEQSGLMADRQSKFLPILDAHQITLIGYAPNPTGETKLKKQLVFLCDKHSQLFFPKQEVKND